MRRQSSCLVSLYLHALHFSDYRQLQQIIFNFNMTISVEILCLESIHNLKKLQNLRGCFKGSCGFTLFKIH